MAHVGGGMAVRPLAVKMKYCGCATLCVEKWEAPAVLLKAEGTGTKFLYVRRGVPGIPLANV